jgi:3-oxoacyl-[acyl-carrier-protein] synthase III
MKPLNYEIQGVSALIGKVISIEEWAQRAQIPNTKEPGVLDGTKVERLLGIKAKSWDPELFGDMRAVLAVARAALDSAQLSPDQVEAAIIVTCSPYQIMLDQDAFNLFRALKLPDDVVPIQLSAGCAGIARAVAAAAMLNVNNVLIVTYNLASLMTGDGKGGIHELYRRNGSHPLASRLWASPGIFSDAAAALVLRRNPEARGAVLYSRDARTSDEATSFEDPLIHYLGGGAACPPGSPHAAELSCYGMQGDQVKRYYTQGMMRNHMELSQLRPDYFQEVERLYTHQASPALIEEFARLAELPADKAPSNARELGNLVSPCTVKMLHDDVLAGRVHNGQSICISVVGAGPERGALLLPLGIREAREVRLEEPGTARA